MPKSLKIDISSVIFNQNSFLLVNDKVFTIFLASKLEIQAIQTCGIPQFFYKQRNLKTLRTKVQKTSQKTFTQRVNEAFQVNL